MPTVTAQRRWFIPSTLESKILTKWFDEIIPEVRTQPGFVSAKLYRSNVPEHYVTSVTWQSLEHLQAASAHFAPLIAQFKYLAQLDVECLTEVLPPQKAESLQDPSDEPRSK